MEWIINNKDWIFSGVGIYIITLFFSILFSKRKKVKKTANEEKINIEYQAICCDCNKIISVNSSKCKYCHSSTPFDYNKVIEMTDKYIKNGLIFDGRLRNFFLWKNTNTKKIYCCFLSYLSVIFTYMMYSYSKEYEFINDYGVILVAPFVILIIISVIISAYLIYSWYEYVVSVWIVQPPMKNLYNVKKIFNNLDNYYTPVRKMKKASREKIITNLLFLKDGIEKQKEEIAKQKNSSGIGEIIVNFSFFPIFFIYLIITVYGFLPAFKNIFNEKILSAISSNNIIWNDLFHEMLSLVIMAIIIISIFFWLFGIIRQLYYITNIYPAYLDKLTIVLEKYEKTSIKKS